MHPCTAPAAAAAQTVVAATCQPWSAGSRVGRLGRWAGPGAAPQSGFTTARQRETCARQLSHAG
eukprot:2902793-Prymnesium_polylepis.1